MVYEHEQSTWAIVDLILKTQLQKILMVHGR